MLSPEVPLDAALPPVPIDALLAHRAWVRSLARSLVRDDAAADDVAQDTWAAALRAPPRDETTSRSWLGVVARNFARAQRRGAARREARERLAARPEAVAAPDVVAQAETHRLVVEAVLSLAEPYRTTVLLRWFEGLEPAAIAARTATPLETVRTRLRRALVLLRERLEPPDEDARRRRLAALAALAGEGEGPGAGAAAGPSSTRGGGRTMHPTTWLAAAAAGAAAFIAVTLLAAGDDAGVVRDPAPVAPAAGSRGIDFASAPQDGGGVRAAPPVPAAPAPQDPAPAPPPTETAARGDLRLRIAVEPPSPPAGDPFELVATFENVGRGPLRFFVPAHPSLVGFPRWRLTAEDGSVHVPARDVAQTMWQEGLQGQTVKLAPGETWSYRARVQEFAPVDPRTGAWDDHRKRVPLRPGRYVVSCVYEQVTDEVPWSYQAFDVEKRRMEGLWTGTARADEVAVQIGGAKSPSLTIEAPEAIVPGAPSIVTVVLENPGAEELTLDGRLVVSAHAKPVGAVLIAAADATAPIRVAAGGRARFTVDLGRQDPAREWQGEVAVVAEVEDGTKRERNGGRVVLLESNLLYTRIAAPRDASADGLRLTASLRAGSRGEPVVDLALRNAGDRTVRVPRDLAGGSAVRFTVARTDGAPFTVKVWNGTETSSSMRWSVVPTAKGMDRAAFRDSSRASEAPRVNDEDLVPLAPGDVITRTVRVEGRAHLLPPGRYTVTVAWRHLAIAPPDVVVGEVTAEPVTLER